MDALTDLLRRLRLRTNIFLHTSFCGLWAVDTSGKRKASFHVVALGECWLHLDGEPPVVLREGDLVVLPHDRRHLIASQATPPGPEVPLNQPSLAVAGSPSTHLICGYFEFDTPAWNPIVEALPEVVVLRAGESEERMLQDSLMRLMINEAVHDQPGSDVILDRLGDALFVLVVRCAMRRLPHDAGYLAALADRQLGQALRAMHAEPARDWTLDGLGRVAGLSRTAFAKRFLQTVGQPPLAYLTRWRMQLAQGWLAEPGLAMIDIAERAGYASEAAFSRAYKREFGISPGATRGRLPSAR
jgi:AraC-like DNA-binding protein